MNEVHITIKESAGAYVTSTVRGLRASCTHSAAEAAARLGNKLFGPALHLARCTGADQPGQSSWLITADPDAHAWCLPSGVIEFGPQVPDTAIEVAHGPDRALRDAVGIKARRGYAPGVLLCPGVPEAPDMEAAFKALRAWVGWCAHLNGTKGSHGVWWRVFDEATNEVPA